MTPVEVASILSGVTALVGAVVLLRRFRPEKDSMLITQAQGAATIYDNLVQTLQGEIERLGEDNARLRADNVRLRLELDEVRRPA